MEEEGEKIKEREIEVSEVKEGGKGKEVVVMDTPDRSRNQIATPVSKFEESPVFNFLNNLSPIKPVKSVHITQTLNALSFASLPSVFTSPHATSLKESRLLRRHQFVDPSKPEFSSDNGNKTDAAERNTNVAHKSNEQQENIDPGNSPDEVSEEQSYDCSKLAVELVHTLNYESTPISSSKTSCPAESKRVCEFTSTSGALVPFGEAVSGKGLYGNGASTEGMSQTSQSGDATGCDWENLISDATDLLIFDSPEDVGNAKKLLDPANGLYSHISTNDMQNVQTLGPVEQGDLNETDNPSTQPGEGSYLKEFSEIQDMLAGSSLGNDCKDGPLSEKTDSEPVSHLYRGMRRRCLVFEMAGARRKHFEENSSSVSPILAQDGNTPSSDKQLLPMRAGNDSSRCILPGIGLHLNALATGPKEYKVVKQDSSVSGKLVIAPSPTANFHSLTTGQERVNQSLAMISMERDMDPVENGVSLLEDASQASTHMVTEEFNQNSPKKKRRRVEQAGESESCKRCNCKKSKCLKLYCECFAAGVYCVEPCSCQECFNKPIHEDTVLATRKQIESRNPLAFAPKVIRSSDSLAEAGDDSTKTPASARHKRGCNCKKSGCLKKYCECYQGGVGCSISCRCEGCKNAFGRKDGSVFIGTEAELEEDETEMLEKNGKERTLHKSATQNDVEQNPESAPPATPFFARPLAQVPFSSKKKPPRSSLPSMGTSSSLYAGQGLSKTTFLPPPQPKFDKHFETVMEEEMPDILLQGNGSPVSGVKSASPNSKRVSPPHCDFGMSPGRRSSRKLILQSIPAFPSLTPKH